MCTIKVSMGMGDKRLINRGGWLGEGCRDVCG